MLVFYKRHIVKSESFEDYSKEDIDKINKLIVREMYSHPEDFHFFQGKYLPVTKNGEAFLENLYSHCQKRTYHCFSFSNGDKGIYEEGTFVIE